MFASLLSIMLLSVTNLGRSKGFQFRPLTKIFFFIFVANFLVLGILGGYHVEDPYVFIGQCSTGFFFSYFIIIVPTLSLIENKIFLSSFNIKLKN